MVDDGLTTIEEMVKVLVKAEEECLRNLQNDLPPMDENGEFDHVGNISRG